MKKIKKGEKIFLGLLLVVLILGSLNVAKAKGWLIPEISPISVYGGTINLDELTLEQKIAQMVIVHGVWYNLEAWKNIGVGGIHLFAMESEEAYQKVIEKFQEATVVPLLVSVDVEGCRNSFSNFRSSVAFSEIETVEEAYAKGLFDGIDLQQLGFTMNYAPVIDLEDQIWNCRAFPGNEENISRLAEAYIEGLQSQEVLAVAKHYPGKTLVARDPHKYLVAAEIGIEDVYPYSYLFGLGEIKAVMVSHIIASGEVQSAGKPAVTSEEVINEIKEEFSGLIVSDEINMLGLKDFYPTLDEMYVAVFKAGNDLILNFNEDPNEIYRMILIVKEAVEREIISEERIDDSVTKIFGMKGLVVD